MTTSKSMKTRFFFGLMIALLIIPSIAIGFRLIFVPMDTALALARELSIFAAAALLLAYVKFGERQPWSSIGLQKISCGQAALATTAGLVACAVATVAGILLIQVLALPFGGSSGGYKPGLWMLSLIVLRAGIVEELCFRAYAISRLEKLTQNRMLIVGLPLVIFAAFHANQGLGGVLLAFLLGAVLTWVYLWKRNLWINMAIHFLVDFIPNVLLASVLN